MNTHLTLKLNRIIISHCTITCFLNHYLRLEALAFYKPIVKLFHPSLASSFVPQSGNKPASCHAKQRRPQASHRLSTNLHHFSLNSNYGLDSRTTLPLSSLLVTTPYTDIIRPVCFLLNMFSYSSCYQLSQHYHQHASHQLLRHIHHPGCSAKYLIRKGNPHYWEELAQLDIPDNAIQLVGHNRK